MMVNRVTQNMMMDRSYLSLQTGLNRLARTQEQLSTGRVINRPSDSPTDTTAAMRLRASLADQAQYARNVEDGLGWLGVIDTTLTSSLNQVNRARELALQGLNAVNQSPQARAALVAEVDQLRESLISMANATYLGRPVFGGLVDGSQAYDAAGAFVGVPGSVSRTVAPGVKVAVDVNGPAVFGPAGATLFDDLAALSNALLSGNAAGVQTSLDALQADHTRITSALTDVGARAGRLERARQATLDVQLTMSGALAEIENVDLARATVDLQLQEVAYQAALSATARLVQPSLADFLR